MPTVVAVVPTFRPPHSTFDLVYSLAEQTSHVVISDDASPCSSDAVLRDMTSLTPVTVIRHTHNRGIARGLNDGLRVAREMDAEWLLTLDQDSQLPSHYVTALLQEAVHRTGAGEDLGAIGAEVVAETSGDMQYPLRQSTYGLVTEELIQSGTLWNVDRLSQIGGFDERLRIDAVDASACLKLRQLGMHIAVAPGLRIEHRIGSARTVHVAGRSIMVTSHSAERRASMVRNRLRLFPAEFRQSPRHALRTLRRVAVNQSLGLLLEGERWSKLKGSARGLRPSGTDNLTP